MNDTLRLSRRQIILAAAALALPALPALPAPRAPVAGIRIVDGWVLTERDVADLGLDAG